MATSLTFADALQADSARYRVALNFSDKGNGPPLLLLHGFAQNSYAFRFIAPELASEHRVLCVDLKGFGESPKPRGAGYSIYHQALSLLALIDELQLHDLAIIGHSFGGGTALALSLLLQARDPGRQTALVHIGGMCYDQEPPFGIDFLRKPFIPYLLFPLFAVRTFVKRGFLPAYFRAESLTDDAVRAYAAPLQQIAGKCAVLHAAREIRPPDVDDFTQRYPQLNIPTLILWGRHDRIVPLPLGERLARELPRAQMKIFDECGHCPHEEKPQETVAAIRDFLTSLK